MKKRLFAALLAGAVALSMVACGGGGSSSSAPAEDKGSAETTEAGGGSYKIDVISLPSTGPTSRPARKRMPRNTPK